MVSFCGIKSDIPNNALLKYKQHHGISYEVHSCHK